MPLPFLLSPYLRPIKTAEGFLLDDGVTGVIELDLVMQDVVRACWTRRARMRCSPWQRPGTATTR